VQDVEFGFGSNWEKDGGEELSSGFSPHPYGSKSTTAGMRVYSDPRMLRCLQIETSSHTSED
jgi:hypothetical protein